MKVVFMGNNSDFAVPTLNALVDAGHEILCVAQPDKPEGAWKEIGFTSHHSTRTES